MIKYKEVFTVYKDAEGNFHRENSKTPPDYLPVKLAVIKPTHQYQQKGQEVYTKRWMELLQEGTPIRAQLRDELKKRKLWNDEMELKEKELISKIDHNLKKVKGRLKLSEASEAMKENIKLRAELVILRFSLNSLEQNTAEAIAEQHRFNYITSVCTIDENGKPYFASLEDFLTKDDEGNPIPVLAGEAMWKLTTNTDADYRADWPEYQFLKKFKLVDDKFNFIKDGKIVDIDNKIVEEIKNEPAFGEILDEDGNVLEMVETV